MQGRVPSKNIAQTNVEIQEVKKENHLSVKIANLFLIDRFL